MILAPAAPTTALPRWGRTLSDPLKMYLGDIYTVSVNLAGLPAVIACPAALTGAGLPVGVQLIGARIRRGERILNAATPIRRRTGFHRKGRGRCAEHASMKSSSALKSMSS